MVKRIGRYELLQKEKDIQRQMDKAYNRVGEKKEEKNNSS